MDEGGAGGRAGEGQQVLTQESLTEITGGGKEMLKSDDWCTYLFVK